jgi:hypothetical protein
LEAPLNLLAFVASVCVIAGLVLSRRLNIGYSLALGVALTVSSPSHCPS